MNNTIAIISEILILIFNILIFMRLTILERESKATRFWMGVGSAVILFAYFVATFYFKFPEVAASFLLVTIPSVAFFWILSKYKDARFFVTFCFLDTATLSLTFFARATEIWFGQFLGIIAYVVVFAAMAWFFFWGKDYFSGYRDLLSDVDEGWFSMALATAAIYVMMIFSATYPKPLIERPEYLLPYAFMCLTVLLIYGVFIQNLVHKQRLNRLNIQLENEKKWHRIAYEDALTGLKNRTAQMECLNNLERVAQKTDSVYVLILDIDDFKTTNDTYGHHEGDKLLKRAAGILTGVFDTIEYQVFRIGGDEFAILTLNADEEDLFRRIAILREADERDDTVSFSIGCSRADFTETTAIEKAMIRADQAMYEEKRTKKCE